MHIAPRGRGGPGEFRNALCELRTGDEDLRLGTEEVVEALGVLGGEGHGEQAALVDGTAAPSRPAVGDGVAQAARPAAGGQPLSDVEGPTVREAHPIGAGRLPGPASRARQS
ncbi:MAG TPA: hypothetical protein VGG06_01615 [Thermoanaerobaculia bacterium]